MQQSENQTTVYNNVHFTVDVIVYMYVNNLTGRWFSIYNVRKCEVERITSTLSSESHAAHACSDEIWQTDQCHSAKVQRTCLL
mgnify:CR=1 FL=1